MLRVMKITEVQLGLIAETLPNIEELEINGVNSIKQVSNDIRFRHLKVLKITNDGFDDSVFPKIHTFSDELEEFEVNLSTDNRSYFKFIAYIHLITIYWEIWLF